MRYRLAAFATFATAAALVAAAPAVDPALTAAIKAPSRTPANVARDTYRHPAETLTFFGVKPNQTVVEIWPAAGWYTEILAPYLRDKGAYYAAVPTDKARAGMQKLIDGNAAAYGKIKLAAFPTPVPTLGVPAGSADVVLTFRNVHNWMGAGAGQTAFDQMFAMLKPGGVLGVVEHRLPEDAKGITEAESGYVKRSTVIALATKAGFKLAGESQVNANPKDTHDYPKGVWTLPPNYAEGDKDRAKYAAIGESDRMTLKFVKPAR